MKKVVDYFLNEGWRVTSNYGMRNDPLNPGNQKMHHGIDFGGKPKGADVTTPYPGVVYAVDTYGGRGLTVIIELPDNVLQLIQHLDSATVKKGDRVESEDVIGKNGSSGATTGPHVHYELRSKGGTSDLGRSVWGDPANYVFPRMAEPTPDPDEGADQYTVVRRDNLTRIGRRFGFTVNALVEFNNIPNRNLIRVGDIIKFPEPVTQYRVEDGDRLWAIGKKFGFKYQELARYNNIANPHLIFPGQIINIPPKG